MPVNKEQHQKDIKRFIAERKQYETFAKTLEQILTAAANIYAPLSIVQVRAKNVSSFAEKIIRKNKYKDPLRDITDLCGARIITQTQEQIDKVCGFIRQNFLIDEANSLDVGERLQIKEFGYRSVHFIITPVKEEILGIKIPDELKDKKAEIQVRTLLQHTWSDVLHDRLYKTALKIPREWERESARLAALLENADENISRITSLTDSYTANFGNRMTADQLAGEIETLRTILDNEPSEQNKPAIALKIARLTKFTGNRKKIIKLLTLFANVPSKVNAEIKTELGYALCKEYKTRPSGKQFIRGEKYLAGVAGIKELEADASKISLKNIPESYSSRLLALRYLAETCEGSRQDDKVKKLYNLAYRMDYDNPYLFAKMLEHNNNFCEHKMLIKGNILKAIELCREHIALGIESIKAYFTIAKLYLLLDDSYPALEACAKAIDLLISEKLCFCREMLDDEIESFARLTNSEKENTGIECAINLLHITNYLLYGENKSHNYLKKIATVLDTGKPPITIIAGGSDNISPVSANKYSRFLNDAVRRYSGTIISGGTTSGVPGLLGTAVELARKLGNREINLIGYIPKKNIKGIKADKAYKLVQTTGDSFTPLEPIRMWCDLIVSGVEPKNVIMLGIDGGKIAAIEYRLALAFGAQLGIVQESGRAANEILKDIDWRYHNNLLPVPNESESVWAFINYRRTDSLFSAAQLEDMAKVIHHNYVQDQLKNVKPAENIKEWKELRADYKNSNINQALFISEILALNGFGIRKTSDDGKAVKEFTKDELLKMSKMEHGRFVAERLLQGWKYGPEKDPAKLISPYLIPWDDVPPEIQQFDVNSINNYPGLLKMAGLEIYRVDD
ncbi:MAG: hypothetical protein HUU54_05575 [Ignavibacteriaceae bacterium]|nr:hypothetical protein [Ignavibacteriaceae bacterium]